MPLREFTDSAGVTWRVWAVIPQMVERRRQQESTDDPPVIERRKRYQPRLSLSDDRTAGWLTFESEAERRRLSPIPDEWDAMSDPGLELLCQMAVSTRKRPRLIE